MTERIKLKRGLADISPIFARTTPAASALRTKIINPSQGSLIQKPTSASEIFFIWAADDETDAHFLNNYFASKIVSSDRPALLLTVEAGGQKGPGAIKKESWSRSLQRLSLSLNHLNEACRQPAQAFDVVQTKEGTQVFLEVGIDSLSERPDLVRLIDQFVIFVKPQVESITEVYRKLKKLAASGLRAEIAVLFDADRAGGLPARLYELFGEFVSRRLCLPVNYLGTLHLSRGGEGLTQDIRWEDWEALRTVGSESIEKINFLSWIDKLYAGGAVK